MASLTGWLLASHRRLLASDGHASKSPAADKGVVRRCDRTWKDGLADVLAWPYRSPMPISSPALGRCAAYEHGDGRTSEVDCSSKEMAVLDAGRASIFVRCPHWPGRMGLSWLVAISLVAGRWPRGNQWLDGRSAASAIQRSWRISCYVMCPHVNSEVYVCPHDLISVVHVA
ncbi:hypothetical protein Dimus_037104, partial [Dionaea muscipula]